jgi:lipopolysaccharide transport system ATP-binding protein
LEPEILIVDEVLAVGDADFQKRCLARMKDVTKEGRTVLFVSHSMSAVKQMCQNAVYLEKGRVLAFKAVDEAADEYQRDVIDMTGEGGWHSPEFDVSRSTVEIFSERRGEVACIGGSVETEDGECAAYLPIERPTHIKLRYRVLKDLPFALVPNFHFYDGNGARVLISMPESLPSSKAGDYCATCVIPPFQLNDGRYYVNPAISSFSQHPPVHFSVVEALRFEVVEHPMVDERRHGWQLALPGTSRPRLPWFNQRLGNQGR